MAYKSKIFFRNIRNLSAARFAAGFDFDLLGFDFNSSSEHHPGIEKIGEIIGWLSFNDVLGTFNTEISDVINDTSERFSLSNVELPLTFTQEKLAQIEQNILVEIVLEKLLENEKLVISWLGIADQIILSSRQSWESLKQNHQTLHTIRTLCESYEVWIAFSFSPESANEMLETLNPHGICFNSVDEEKPGIIDLEQFYPLLEALAE